MMLAGFETATHGEIELGGRPINNIPPHKRGIGMVFQNYALFPHMTVVQNVVFGIAEKGSGLRLPHIGWNTVEPMRADPLMSGTEDSHFYFVHSYAVRCVDAYALARTEYGGPFISAVRRDNVIGVQFHPEKSGAVGIQLLQNFMTVSSC